MVARLAFLYHLVSELRLKSGFVHFNSTYPVFVFFCVFTFFNLVLKKTSFVCSIFSWSRSWIQSLQVLWFFLFRVLKKKNCVLVLWFSIFIVNFVIKFKVWLFFLEFNLFCYVFSVLNISCVLSFYIIWRTKIWGQIFLKKGGMMWIQAPRILKYLKVKSR